MIAVSYVGTVISAFGSGSGCLATPANDCSNSVPTAGLVVLFLGFIVAFLATILLRILLEVIAVLFAIHDDINALRGRPDAPPT